MRPPDPKKEQLIRRKAIAMVGREGLDGFSMQRLAKAVKISPSTLYVYFEDRDDLLFQLFKSEMVLLQDQLLAGFSPEMSFAEGLRVQWKNRTRYALTYPQQSDFLDQIRYSPYHARFMAKMSPETFAAMRSFVMSAVQRGELAPVPVEVYWSFAFAPLYQLIKYHRNGFGFPAKAGEPARPRFVLDDDIMDRALDIAVRGLRPDPSAPPPSLSFCR